MYQIRTWQPADLPWLQWAAANATWESLSAEERAGVTPSHVATAASQQMAEILQAPGNLTLIAQTGGQPIGYASAAISPDSTTGEMNGLVLAVWVAPEHRRRRLGRTLQQLTEIWMANQGIRKAKLWTGLHNQAFHRMATACGYRPEGLIGMKALG